MGGHTTDAPVVCLRAHFGNFLFLKVFPCPWMTASLETRHVPSACAPEARRPVGSKVDKRKRPGSLRIRVLSLAGGFDFELRINPQIRSGQHSGRRFSNQPAGFFTSSALVPQSDWNTFTSRPPFFSMIMRSSLRSETLAEPPTLTHTALVPAKTPPFLFLFFS